MSDVGKIYEWAANVVTYHYATVPDALGRSQKHKIALVEAERVSGQFTRHTDAYAQEVALLAETMILVQPLVAQFCERFCK